MSRISTLDWSVIVAYIVFSIGVGLLLSKRGTRSTKDYFTSGGGMPWWILGTSMVATTFAADTPLAISGMVVTEGFSGQWFWWCQVPITMLGVFFFSRLWQRIGVLTDNEFVHVRYSGKAANYLRGFRAVYFSVVYQCIVMGWVNLAMVKIIGSTIEFGPWPVIDGSLEWVLTYTMGLGQEPQWFIDTLPGEVGKMKILLVCFLITLSYTSISGLWGVLITDFFQFFLAMGGTILLAVLAVDWAGGMPQILADLKVAYGDEHAAQITQIVPIATQGMAESTRWGAVLALPYKLAIPFKFLIYMLVFWWAVGYTDGGSYLAQRMLAAKDERHSLLGYLWYGICHYCLRPWPWLIVGLVAAVKFKYNLAPDGSVLDAAGNPTDPELGYIKVMLSVLPSGLLGMLLASFLAAYMSTISTGINLGASYLVNDLYRPFIKTDADEKHYVRVSICAAVLMAMVGIVVTLFFQSIKEAWFLLAAINAGVGIIYLARWYWWRVNAWSEISCLVTCVTMVGVLWLLAKLGIITQLSGGRFDAVAFPYNLLVLVPVSLAVWLTVTFLTKPVDDERLRDFYRRVRPGGPGWKRIAAEMPELEKDAQFTMKNLVLFLLSVVALYSALIGIGELILGRWALGGGLLLVTVVSAAIMWKSLSTEKWGTQED